MKKRFTFNRLLHKDKLMMVISLILAIVIWVLVDVDQEITYEEELLDIPVRVQLSGYAENQGLRIMDGDDITATVKVSGTRAELKGLKPSDITITADASAYLYDGKDYQVRLSAVSKKGNIVDISGNGIQGSKLQEKWILIDLQRYTAGDFKLTALNEKQIQLSGLKCADSVRVLSVMLDDESVKDGEIKVYGPTVDVEKIDAISVDLSDTTVSQTDRFTVSLKAYDKKGAPIDGLTFLAPESGKVGVVVRAIVYRNEHFTVQGVANAPAGFEETMIRVSPPFVELGEVSGEQSVLDSYIKDINEALMLNFDQWLAEGKVAKSIPLNAAEGVYLDRVASPSLTVSLDVEGYGNIKKNFALTLGENVFIQCDEGVEATLLQEKLANVIICGPKDVIKNINSKNIRIDIDARGQVDGHQGKVAIRPQIMLAEENSDDLVWIYYGEDTLEVEYAIAAVQEVSELSEDDETQIIE